MGTTLTETQINEVEKQRERLIRVLAAITFLIFFQAYMVAPLIPRLSTVFHVSAEKMGLVVPAYLIPYGVSTLFYGLVSDWIGRRRIMMASLAAFTLLTGLTALSQSADQLIFWRLLTGIGASGVVPLALAAIGILFPYEQRGRPLGWLFGAMAGGMAFGSTFGALLEPILGWRGIFLAVSGFGAIAIALLSPVAGPLGETPNTRTITLRGIFTGYKYLLEGTRGRRAYIYVFINSIFHSGVFTWLGLYFARRYGLGEIGIGLALLGYGVPGFVLGPIIGRLADRWGRRWLIPAGLGIAAVSSALLIPHMPLIAGALAVTSLSLGYDMTQPLLAGIVTSLDPKRAGQAMGLNVFALFTGFGLGSLFFGAALRLGFGAALGIFTVMQLVLTLFGIGQFRSEARAPAQVKQAADVASGC